MNTAEYIVKKIEELGVNDFFGVTRKCNVGFLCAAENNQNINWLECTSELNTLYSADGYARIRGYGVSIISYGSGEFLSLNGIAGCYAENVPLIIVVGVSSGENSKNEYITDIVDKYQSITASTALLTRDNAKLEIDRTLKTCVKERKPVLMVVPEDVAQMDIPDRNTLYEWTSCKEVLEDLAKRIAEKISNSERPVIIGGSLIKRYDCRIEYKEFVEKSGIPVSNVLDGINLVDADYEKYLGGYFGNVRNPIAQNYIEKTDCLITIGVNQDESSPFGTLPYVINDHIAINGNYTYVEGVRYDDIKMSELLNEITNIIITKEIDIDKPNVGLKYIDNDSGELCSDYIFSEIQKFIKDNDMIFAETDIVQQCISQMKFLPSVNIEFQTHWNSKGWATPAVSGACAAKPQSRVILITGPREHQYTALELGTMLLRGIKPIIIVFNNLGTTIDNLTYAKPESIDISTNHMNYAKFARTFEGDIWSTRVTTAEDFNKALKVTQIMNKMCYIEACVKADDLPAITKDFINSINQNLTDIKPLSASAVKDTDELDKLIYTAPSSGLKYETIVHKGFNLEQTEQTELK